MAITVNTNVSSLNAQRNLAKTGSALAGNFQRLSSGLRINRAGDDAAGLAISEDMKAQIRSMSQAERNANDGVSMLQTAEGALGEVGGILGRMRELATQSANGTLDATQRGYVQEEFVALSAEIDRIGAVTEYNGTALLDGIIDVAESIFNLPTRLGRPAGISGLVDVVNNPMYATGVGLVMYGAKHRESRKFRIRDKNIFNRVMTRMKKWFHDVV